MRAEVIGIGTEILLGEIANTNARWISERLAEVGVDVLHHQTVGDNLERIADAFRLALSRADVVIATGGLGPTGDDITREGLAAALGVELRRERAIEDHLRAWFAGKRRTMPESNLRQADLPEGARWIRPELGTAPGLILERQGRRVYVVPGVPAEMREMMEREILPELRRLSGATIRSKVVKASGLAEAVVGERLAELFESSTNPTVAFLSSGGEVRVRLTAKAETEEEAERLIHPVAEKVRGLLGDAVFGEDEERLEEVVGRLLAERELHLACAESLTGGLLAARLVSVPDASKHFSGAAVVYAPDAKRDVLGVSQATIDGPGTVSEECAIELARGARKVFKADVGLSLTGVAGPEPLEGKEPGTVWVGLSTEATETARTFVSPGDRDMVRRAATQAALDLLRRHLLRQG
ncbi:MAG TPA: competence/damage-inducible protein A [Actinomycetota bacterium]|nr:competence/damage-inducible protein A [Actinomycetota bacterium]